jgi:hypothetical protein
MTERNPGGGRRENRNVPRGRGTVTRGKESPRTAQQQPTERARKLRHEIGRDQNDRE